MKRLLRWFVLVLVWIGGTILGATAAALRTEAGVRVVVQTANAAVRNTIHGSLVMDSVSGKFSSGLQLWNAEIRGPDGVPFVVVPRLQLTYDIGTLLSRRFVLGELTIEGLVVDLIQVERGGPFNVDIIFAGDTTSPDIVVESTKPYLAFRDVQIVNASVIIRTPADASEDLPEAERRETGYYRVRRIQEINAVFPFVRFVSPVPGEDPIAIDIESLAASINDPGFELIRARGSAEVWSDSVTFAFDEVEFPESEARVRGALFWPTGPLQFDLQIDADHVHTNDLTGLVGAIPRDLEGSANVTVRSLSEDVLVMNVADMDLTGRGGGGRVTGTLGMQFWPDTWAQRRTDLTLENFDLEYVRHLLDTLPVAGRVTGRVKTDGRRDSLTLEIDATFRDSLVGVWPETYFRGQGLVSLGVPGDFVFREFDLDSADISLETVHRLVPAIQLVGRIRGAGTLDGPWLQATYEGRIRYQDPGLPETLAEGSVRIDATGEVVGVWGALAFDSLRLAGLHSSYPGLPSLANLAGLITIDGYLDSVFIDADLAGPSGAVRLRGPFVFDGDRSGAYAFEILASGVDVSAYHPSLASTRINGRVTGRGWRSDTQESVLETRLELARSELRGVVFDAITGGVSIRDSLIVVDSLEARIGLSRLTANGALGTAQPRRERLQYSILLNDIASLEPWIAGIIGEIAVDTLPPGGRVRVSGELNGAADAFVLLGDVQAFDVTRGAIHVSRFGGSGTWASASKALRVNGTADSIRVGPVMGHAASFTIQGRPDSLQWRLETGLQQRIQLTGGGQLVRDSAVVRLEVDSLQALVHTSHWYAESFAVELSDSAAVFRGIQFLNDSGAGRIELDGRLPFKGNGLLDGSVRALPIGDVWALLGYDPEDVSGQVAGTFSQVGTARDPIIEVAVLVTGGRFGEFSAPQTSGQLRYRDRRVTGDLDLIRLGHSILQVEVDVPYDLGIGSVGQRRVPGSLSITGRADSVDLSLFNAINPAVQNAVGTFDANLGVAGTWEEPLLTGSLTVAAGGASFPALGVRYDSINGMIELVGDTIHMRTLSATSGTGTATVGGFVRLEELSKPILALTVHTDAFDAINVPGFLSLTTTGDVRFDGPVFNATMTGSATAARGVIYFADLITKEIVNLEDSLFLQDSLLRSVVAQVQEEGLGAAFENRFLDSLRIDNLDLSIGSEVWLRSGEANIQMTGALLVDKVLNVYTLDGELQTPRGSYRLEVFPTVTREFTVTGGTVRYFGTSDFNAGLDIRARHIVRARGRAEDVDIFVTIGGTLYEPELTLTSNVTPALSGDEIMAYLLFGEAALDPGQMQAAEFASERLTQAVSGQVENFVIGSMDVPLDYFQIRPAARGGFLAGAEVSVGKQFDILGRTAFLTATPRYCPRLASTPLELGASLEFRFSRRWLLEASVEPRRSCDSFTARTATVLESQFGLDLIWEMSY